MQNNTETANVELLTPEEQKSLLEIAEDACERIISNRPGGLSGINRPFYLIGVFKEVIERYGHRDVGYHHSHDDLVKMGVIK